MRSDVLIVLKRSSDTGDVITELATHDDTKFHDINLDLGVIEATIDAEHVHPLHHHPGISYVRPILTYHTTATP